MNLSELSALLSDATEVLRLEALDRYNSVNDDGNFARYVDGEPGPDRTAKQGWLDRLAGAADRGHPWRRLRVVHRPVPQYVRYSAEWGYVDNVAAGEDVRVLDEAIELPGYVNGLPDTYVVDGSAVVMTYDEDGRFVSAHEADDGAALVHAIELAWTRGRPFLAWWDAHPELHRDLVRN